MKLIRRCGSVSYTHLDVYKRQILFGSILFGSAFVFLGSGNVVAMGISGGPGSYTHLRQIARLIAELQLAQASAERVLSLLDSEPQIVDTPEVIEKYGTELEPKLQNYEPLVGDVEFRHVDFEYLEGERVLTDFNLKVKAGQTVALVGETGSGKSTVVNLLCRFYQPVNGQVLIDGKDRCV